MNKYNIGDIIKFNGIKLKIIEAKPGSCENCYFNNKSHSCAKNSIPDICSYSLRTDHKNIIFKQIK